MINNNHKNNLTKYNIEKVYEYDKEIQINSIWKNKR